MEAEGLKKQGSTIWCLAVLAVAALFIFIIVYTLTYFLPAPLELDPNLSPPDNAPSTRI